MSANERTGGQILIDQLRLHGVELIFGVPGESYLPALDALYDVPEIRFIVCRQEGGAAMMADAYGKLTGRPGVAFVTRGPGASNASAGVHIAEQDSTPMLLLVGQIDRGAVGRGTFQEVDYRQFFGGMVKWAAEVDDPGRLPELVHRAFMTATSGRPGPVVLSLPEDMLAQRSGAGDARPFRPVEAAPSSEALDRLRSMLEAAQRPILIVGGGGWNAQATADLARFVEANELPMAAGFRRQDLLDNEHPCYAGDIAIGPNPKLVQRIRGSDLIVAIGTRLSEMTTQGYSLLGVPRPEQPLVHIHNDPAELGRVYQPDLAIVSGMGELARALAAMPPVAPPALGRGDPCGTCRLSRLARADADSRQPAAGRGGPVAARPPAARRDRHQRCRQLLRLGQPLLPLWRLSDPARSHGRLDGLWRPGCDRRQDRPAGARGRRLRRRRLLPDDRPGACHGRAVRSGDPHHRRQQRHLRHHQDAPGARASWPRDRHQSLRNPDFVAYARAFGAFGARATTTDELKAAWEEAASHPGPALIEAVLDAEAITPRATITSLREQAIAAGRGR